MGGTLWAKPYFIYLTADSASDNIHVVCMKTPHGQVAGTEFVKLKREQNLWSLGKN